ncbi:hypothetical protein [Actinacidiphila guanduensis]|uniref:hypothetical protein n=1 Tax=Actinacidiphila guanduensis TaxID=310781 RepID=UPI0038996D71
MPAAAPLTPAVPGPPAPASPAEPATATGRARRRDLAAGLGAVLFFLALAGLGGLLQRDHQVLQSPFPPLEAWWRPHTGPGTPFAITVAVLAVAYGPALAARLPWRAVPWAAWAAAMAWTWSLALVDGWQRGIAGQLTANGEYLTQLNRFDPLGPALRTYTDHILINSPEHWTTHIAGHPAGAVLTFVVLDRIGLGGGVAASVFVLTTATSTAAAVLVALWLLAGEERARAAAPFAALAPGAVWVGVSGDGYFAAVAAWGLALLALAATRTSRAATAAAGLAAGVLLGWACYLSYGLTLLAVPAAVVLLCARSARPLPYALAGVAAVAAAFTAAGFDWLQAYGLLHTRYYQGVGGRRPYSYWIFGDLATVVAAAGPAAMAGLRRSTAALPAGVRALRTGRDRAATAAVLLPYGFLLAMLAADLSGMSKAETERIWLPFTLWLPAAAAFLPRRDARWWLAAQVAAGLFLNHLLHTVW